MKERERAFWHCAYFRQLLYLFMQTYRLSMIMLISINVTALSLMTHCKITSHTGGDSSLFTVDIPMCCTYISRYLPIAINTSSCDYDDRSISYECPLLFRQ